jgi:hypothetical protein
VARAGKILPVPAPERVQRLILAGLSARLKFSRHPVYRKMAWMTACVGLSANPTMRRVGAAAVQALGEKPTRDAVWRFTWDWWYQRATGEILAYQADLLTPEWATHNVTPPPTLPKDGCILLSVHHFHQLIAFARLSAAVGELGATSLFEPLPLSDANSGTLTGTLDAEERHRRLSRYTHRVFGPRIYVPSVAARRGLELLRRGGYLVVLADFFGRDMTCLLGKELPVAVGPIWLAERSGRPIVPFLASPPASRNSPWNLWCGEPIPATREAVIAAVDGCIRAAPTSWMSWRGWYHSPDCFS